MAEPVSVGTCYRCGEPMWMTAATRQTYLRNHAVFYCTHGHQQHFAEGKTREQKLQEQLDDERRQRQRAEQRVAQKDDEIGQQRLFKERAERSASAYKGQATRLRNRAKTGVCPCCNRTFQQLARHMASQHPDFTPADVPLPEGVAPILH